MTLDYLEIGDLCTLLWIWIKSISKLSDGMQYASNFISRYNLTNYRKKDLM